MELPEPKSIRQLAKKNLSVVAYGYVGTGKTLFAAGFPGPVLILDADDGSLSIKTTEILNEFQKAQVHPVEIKDFLPITGRFPGYDTIVGIMKKLVSEGAYMGIKPRTVVYDSLTTISEMCMAKQQYNNNRLGQLPVLQDYGGQRKHLLDLIHLGLAYDGHFVAVCHESFQKDEFTGRVWLRPMVVGKLAEQLPLYFDEVYHTVVSKNSKGETEWKMECSGSGLNVARSRLGLSGTLPLTFESIRRKLSMADGSASATGQKEEVVQEQEAGGQKVKGSLVRD